MGEAGVTMAGLCNALEVRDLSFAYPGAEAGETGWVLRHVGLAVPEGAFCLLVGPTGCGKTTLLRLAKPELAPVGTREGSISLFGEPLDRIAADPRESARTVGYVFQSPEGQIVCDSVWREMAFGLESLCVPRDTMRRRVAETCDFLGMGPWFRRECSELSGGQRQVLALASVLAMRPRLLLLDEPTSMLDPVAERNFASLLFRVNRELGVTVVVATHDPRPLVDYADVAVSMEGGALREVSPDALRDEPDLAEGPLPAVTLGATQVQASDAWFRYGRDDDWVLRGLDLSVSGGETRAIVGGNGSGKTTLLSLVAGVGRPQRGRVRNWLRGSQVLLPQNPKALLSQQSVLEELMEWSRNVGYGRDEAVDALDKMGMGEELLPRHPYDLSGGQQQLLAYAKLALAHPALMLLDEPTKGLDLAARRSLARALREERGRGTTVLLSTHDLAFVRAVADSVTLLFDGQKACTQATGEYFAQSWL